MKNKVDNTSYFKIYIYLLVLLVCLVLYLFVFSKTNTTNSVLIHNETTVTVPNAMSNAKTVNPTKNPAPVHTVANNSNSNTNNNINSSVSNPNTNNTNLANSSSDNSNATNSTNNSTNSTVSDTYDSYSDSNDSATDNENGKYLPINTDNIVYQSLAIKKYVVANNQTIFGLLSANGYSTNDAYAIYAKNKRLLNNVHAGDLVLIKTKNGRIVVLSLVKGGDYEGQFVYDETNKQYKFIK